MNKVKPYKNVDTTKKEQVTNMFDNISGEYDRLNRVISFGIDVKWRNKVVEIVKSKKPELLLLSFSSVEKTMKLALIPTAIGLVIPGLPNVP